MAHINTDDHGLRRDVLREHQLVQVATELRVDLHQHIACHRHVHAFAKVLIPPALRDDVVQVLHVLEGLVLPLVSQHHQANGGFLLGIE